MDELLVLENVFYESAGMENLRDVSFSLNKGDNVVLFGPEGSGLPHLCSLIIGLADTTGGDIRFKGKSIRDFDYVGRFNYKKEIGFLHQHYGLISNMTAEENISLPLQYHSHMTNDEIRHYVRGIISDLNLDSCKNFRPVDLSYSETLRTAYARATVLDPDLLLVEHAFEGQSPMNMISFMDVIRNRIAHNEKSVLFVTYEPQNFIDMAHRFIMFFNGRIVFSGGFRSF
jgi:ABC-type transporter Mla maintaining outer membrane lipid asymmetry ATPase subunit MlaF